MRKESGFRVFLAAGLLLVAVVFALPTLLKVAPKWSISSLFRPKHLNSYLLEAATSFPEPGFPVIDASTRPSSYGVTRPIVYQGRTVASPDQDKGIYCVGLVFDLYMKACEFSGGKNFTLPGLSTTNFRYFRRDFYGVDGHEKTFVRALVERKLGEEIMNPEQALPGDLVQLWRRNSGHSAIFLEWVKDENDAIVGIVYWGTNRGKIGVGRESLGESGIQRYYIVRPFTPK